MTLDDRDMGLPRQGGGGTVSVFGRNDLARHLYIHGHDEDGATPQWRDRFAAAWDTGKVTPEDRAAFYADADRLLAEEVER